MLLNQNKKKKHVSKVRDHIFYLHRCVTSKAMELQYLRGKNLNKEVKSIQALTKRMKEYQKYLNLILM